MNLLICFTFRRSVTGLQRIFVFGVTFTTDENSIVHVSLAHFKSLMSAHRREAWRRGGSLGFAHSPTSSPSLNKASPVFLAWPSNLASSLGVQHDLSQGCQGLSEHTGPAFVYRAKSLSSMQSALVGIRTAPFRQGWLCGQCVVAYSAEAGRALIWPYTGIFIYRSFTGMYRSKIHTLWRKQF